ncbi:MAG TPA: hypothetical protein VGS07_23685 [Thermoanaerobaculia bacterium]|nr:hypothetical protein [Thermoanaerobaculia bacterium]
MTAEVINFTEEEWGWLQQYCGRLPLSPRAIKRIVNAFKLLKIVWSRPNRHLRPEREVQQGLVALLALSAAYPTGMRLLFSELLERSSSDRFEIYAGLKKRLGQMSLSQEEKIGLEINLTLIPISLVLLPELRVTFELVRSLSFVAEIGRDPAEESEPRA